MHDAGLGLIAGGSRWPDSTPQANLWLINSFAKTILKFADTVWCIFEGKQLDPYIFL